MNFEQTQWLELISTGSLTSHSPSDEIESYCVGDFWLDLLSKKTDPDWYECNQLGVMSYAKGDFEKAKEYFVRSIELCENPWSYRNLAQIEKNIEGNKLEAASHMLAAIALKNDYLPLAIETAYALMNAERYREFVMLYDTLPENIRNNGRMKMLLGACFSNIGDLDNAISIINPSLTVDDIKEGEYSLSAIWVDIYREMLARKLNVKPEDLSVSQILDEYPLPYELDYRMH